MVDENGGLEAAGMVDDTESLRKLLEEEKDKVEKYLSNWQRTQADFVNYKKRIEQDQVDSVRYANVRLIQAIIPVLDDFERAFSSVPPNSPDSAWLEGIILVQRKLRGVLEAECVLEIKALGETFDPVFHEAVSEAQGEDGKVVEEVQKGYMLHDRVIRPAIVVVGKG